jgi:hypothetical protein
MCFVKMYVFEFFLLHMFCMLIVLGLLFACKGLLFTLQIVIVTYITCTFILYEKTKKNEISCHC